MKRKESDFDKLVSYNDLPGKHVSSVHFTDMSRLKTGREFIADDGERVYKRVGGRTVAVYDKSTNIYYEGPPSLYGYNPTFERNMLDSSDEDPVFSLKRYIDHSREE